LEGAESHVGKPERKKIMNDLSSRNQGEVNSRNLRCTTQCGGTENVKGKARASRGRIAAGKGSLLGENPQCRKQKKGRGGGGSRGGSRERQRGSLRDRKRREKDKQENPFFGQCLPTADYRGSSPV